jgi:hypothetical protein
VGGHRSLDPLVAEMVVEKCASNEIELPHCDVRIQNGIVRRQVDLRVREGYFLRVQGSVV